MSQSEHELQNRIRNALVDDCLLFRANVGKGWTGDQVEKAHGYKKTTTVLNPGDVVIRNARPFDTGLPNGFSDLFGLVPIEITPAHIGQRLGLFAALEVKSETGRVRKLQQQFIDAVQFRGGRAGVVRSIDDAKGVIRGR